MIFSYLAPAQDEKQKMKSLPKLESLRGSARDEEMKLRLQQGASIVEIAAAFKRTPEFIAREHRRLFYYASMVKNRQLVKNRHPWRKAPWSNEEIRSLTSLRDRGHKLSVISSWLLRTEQNVKKMLTEMVVDVTPKGPQELPPGLREKLFNERLNQILRGLSQRPMTSKWQDHILSKPLEEWAILISRGIPDRVKSALGGLTAPTYKELMDMPDMCTTDAGVYARLMHTTLNLGNQDRFVYVGSASRFGGGLNARIMQHVSERRQTRLQELVKRKGLRQSRNFITLMTVEIATSKHVLEIRRRVVLAEAVMTVWLGALNTSRLESHSLRLMYPWDPVLLDYVGASTHNPLEYDVMEPDDQTVEALSLRPRHPLDVQIYNKQEVHDEAWSRLICRWLGEGHG